MSASTPPDSRPPQASETARADAISPAAHDGHAVPAGESPGSSPTAANPVGKSAAAAAPPRRRWPIFVGVVALLLALVGFLGAGTIRRAIDTVSTDDAYVNSHVTFVAPRVDGQVTQVLVDDNNHVHKGDLLVQLDQEPYQIQRDIKQAAVDVAEADLVATRQQVRGLVAQARSNRFKLQHAIEQVDNQVAQLKAAYAAYENQLATLELARADIHRAEKLLPAKAISQEDYDKRLQQFKVGEAQVRQALEEVHQIRVSLGLPAEPKSGKLTDVPADLDQNFSSVRQALADLMQSAAPLGIIPKSYDAPPRKIIEDFYNLQPGGNVDKIYAQLMKEAPIIKQAESKVEQTQRDLAQAELNLRYCQVTAEVDGVITRRNVNPGNHVQPGQALMAIRSLHQVWVDANFKETQLRDLRIGQRVEMEVDMYGNRRTFAGRISGFTMGTGSTLALLPPQNATGNFIKVVQRLPVRIEFTDYDPEKTPLFVGLSVVPYVYVKEPPAGPDAGKMLQPHLVTTPAPPASASSGKQP